MTIEVAHHSNPDVWFQPLKAATHYLSPADQALLFTAYQWANQAHQGQNRKSGEPYITHPISVAVLAAQWHLDAQALTAALLHDTVEDTHTTIEQIKETFGPVVSLLVEGLSKLDRLEFQTEQQAQAENFRKMLLAMARDVRIILIKLADRLHNMRTLSHMDPVKQKKIARETLEIYSPIANRLGLNALYLELEDLGFRYLFPNRYLVISKAIRAAKGNHRELVHKTQTAIEQKLASIPVPATVFGREKNISSIYQKMQSKSLSFSQVLDIYGFRILVPTWTDCYLALGALHQLYKPIPGKFKDYIAIPKSNGYQSLHSLLIGPFGTPIEIQIRSHDMNQIAEAGVASHWLYKTQGLTLSSIEQNTHAWLQSLLELQQDSPNASEFLEHLKIDLYPDEVYVFTPKGTIKALPRGATAVDFAYSVHTDIGNHCVGAKINHQICPLQTVLNNGEQVEIITEPMATPNPAWLNYTITAKARSKIRQHMRSALQSDAQQLGQNLLNQALRALNTPPEDITELHWKLFLKGDHCQSSQEVLSEIGLGKRLNVVVAKGLLAKTELTDKKQDSPILIQGSRGIAVHLSPCCRPIPGDPIIGLIRKGKGLQIHTQDCRSLRQFRTDPDKWIDVAWSPESGLTTYSVSIRLLVHNQPGVLAKISSIIAHSEANIEQVSVTSNDAQFTELLFTIQVHHRQHLNQICGQLQKQEPVIRIERLHREGTS